MGSSFGQRAGRRGLTDVTRGGAAAGPSTPATVILDRAAVPYTRRIYDHDPSAPSYGLEAAAALGVDPARVFKTLLTRGAAGYGVAVIPVSHQLNLKRCAAALGQKKVAMADPAEAERLTGYVVGGMSPIGQKRRLPTVIDTSAATHTTVLVSGGRRGFDLELDPAHLIRVTSATTHDLVAEQVDRNG